MQELPISQVIPEIIKHLSAHNRLILQAPPGAGKTTLVPLSLLDQSWLHGKQIVMLQPRRLATRTAAARMAELLGEHVGETVGYQIRQDKKYSDRTRIIVVTEGILARMLQNDPELAGVGLVIFDEFHERSLHADLSLAFCLQSQEVLNESLKIMLMSATLNTDALSELLNTADNPPPVVSSQGRSYPVEIIYRSASRPVLDRHNLTTIVSQQVVDALHEHNGNILVFLPGTGEIKRVAENLRQRFSQTSMDGLILAPLYGDLDKRQQDQAIAIPPDGHRKIVLATNIAETSLTIEGVSVVIDSGLHRQASFNPGSGMNGLHTTMVARDSADQRCGRAGRLSTGTCYRLWNDSQQKQLTEQQRAEILRSDLAPTMLELAQWGIQDLNELHWLDTPPAGHAAQAQELLLSLQAINARGQITTHGKNILQLGVHPRLAHMILKADELGGENLAEMGCQLAALLSEKDILTTRHNNETQMADISTRLAILQQINGKSSNDSATNRGINKAQCHRVLQTARDFYRRLKTCVSSQNIPSFIEQSTEMIGVLVALAYPDRIAQIRNQKDGRYLLSNGKGARFMSHDSLANEEYLAIASLYQSHDQQIPQKEARIFLAAPITLVQLEDYFSDLIQTQDDIRWDAQKQKVNCLKKTTLGRLVLSEQQSRDRPIVQVHTLLLNGIRSIGLDCLPWSDTATRLRQRIRFLYHQQHNNPDCVSILKAIDLPDLGDERLLTELEQWLLPHLNEETSIQQLQALNMEGIVSSLLSWEQLQTINELAPEKICVPSGSSVRIDYEQAHAPFLAVRLQELFGLKQTPSIINGCYPLLLHLLSPAFRPMQVTQDLASFWENTYTEVKKELRGKYKKHYWPDDPLLAQATNRTKPRKS